MYHTTEKRALKQRVPEIVGLGTLDEKICDLCQSPPEAQVCVSIEREFRPLGALAGVEDVE
jgi:hypothetical protein